MPWSEYAMIMASYNCGFIINAITLYTMKTCEGKLNQLDDDFCVQLS